MTCLEYLSSRIPQVQIYISPPCRTLRDRIELSSGTRIANENEVGEGAYEDGARLPREPWRLPTKKEVKRLFAAQPPIDTAQSVYIVRLPGGLPDQCRDVIRGEREDALHTNVIAPLQTICEFGEPLKWIGRTSHPANLKTVTVNHDLGRYIGLHVDNWDQLNVESLDRATNRICVNLGECDRYFLFLPFSVMKIVTVLAEELGAEWVPPGRYTLIARTFVERFPNLPVIRCRLEPGDAYIAPTENLVHDASTIGQHSVDEPFTILGHIRLRERKPFSISNAWLNALNLIGLRSKEWAG